MPLMSIGAVLLVLIIIFIFSRIWFHLVEGIFGVLKRPFRKKGKPSAWHSLPSEPDSEANEEPNDHS